MYDSVHRKEQRSKAEVPNQSDQRGRAEVEGKDRSSRHNGDIRKDWGREQEYSSRL